MDWGESTPVQTEPLSHVSFEFMSQNFEQPQPDTPTDSKNEGAESIVSESKGPKSEEYKSEGAESIESQSKGPKSEESKIEGAERIGSESNEIKNEGSKSEESKRQGSKSEGSKIKRTKSQGSKSEGSKSRGTKTHESKGERSTREAYKSQRSKDEGFFKVPKESSVVQLPKIKITVYADKKVTSLKDRQKSPEKRHGEIIDILSLCVNLSECFG